MLDHITICRKTSESELSKLVEQHLDGKHATLTVATTPVPPPMGGGGTSLTICSNAEARHSTQQVLQYLESLKHAEANWKGNRSSHTTSNF
jgi:hypothetical protein